VNGFFTPHSGGLPGLRMTIACPDEPRLPLGQRSRILLVGVPALMLDVKLGSAPRDPVPDALARRGIGRQLDSVSMPVRALNRDQPIFLGDRRHWQAAPLAIARSVGQELAQVPADLLENDAFLRSLPYTTHIRRGSWPRRLFAPGQRSAASPRKGRSIAE
jgi:hypothetical protein